MCVNVPFPTEIRVRGQGIPYTDKFTYLGSVLCQDGGTGVDIQNRLNKARNTFMSLRSVWRSESYSTKTKLSELRDVNSSLRLGVLANDGAQPFKTSVFPHS